MATRPTSSQCLFITYFNTAHRLSASTTAHSKCARKRVLPLSSFTPSHRSLLNHDDSSSPSSSTTGSHTFVQSSIDNSNPSSSSSSPPADDDTSVPVAVPVRVRGASEAAQRHDRFKVQRRVAVGFIMGAVVIAFVFSGRLIFASGMLTISLIGLYEYYRMVTAKGHLPAYKMGLFVTTVTMIFAAFLPALADVTLPVGGTCICIYLLLRQGNIATIADISTTFMGLFYAGYLPSFWIRLHEYNKPFSNNIVASIIGKVWPGTLFGLQPTVTFGSLLIFWTWLAAASSDIGAFFFGRIYGKTKLTNISPKKTLEGAIAGFICSASVSILGAFLLKWPLWYVTGPVYGITVGVLGLCGDLFESCFKRDVGWKDSGSLFPGHGGMLDRADSYVLVAPLVYFFTTLVLPWITRLAG